MWSLAFEMILIWQDDAKSMNILRFCEAERNNLWKAISRKIVYIPFSTTQNYIEFFFLTILWDSAH